MRKLSEEIFYIIAALATIGFIGFVAFLFFLLFGFTLEPNVYYASFTLVGAIFILILATTLPWKKVRKGALFGGLAVLLAGVIAICACVGYNSYMDSLVVIDNSAINTQEYLAFHPDSKIARLEKEASLRFTMSDNLPVLDGAAAFFPVYSAFVEAVYPKNIPALNREESPYQYNNTIIGYELLARGLTDILFVFGPDEEQLAYAEEQGVEFELIPIGGEGFVFFTNARNPVTDLAVEQIRSIYGGEITNWKELGGENTKILPYQRNSGSGSQTALVEFMGDVPLMEAPSELVNGMMTGIIEVVADYHNHRGAMGFSFHHYAEEIVANKDIRLLSVNGVQPSKETIASGSYPVLMPFYMVVRKGERTKEMNELIEWVLSEEGQYLIAASGYATVS